MAIEREKIGRFMERTTRSVVMGFAPQILGGVLTEVFRGKHITVKGATEWVERNQNLWDSMGSDHQRQIRRAATKLGSLDFVNADWAINSLRKEMPALASLYLGWRKGYNWLERQLQIIKQEAKK